jgi:hypothetical protein
MIINPYIYGVATSYDADAQLFFNAESAAGVTLTTTQMDAVNQWVVDAKAAGIWTKFKAIYPFVGGTATAHKFNLKNPLDTDAAFRLTFTGGWTHSSTGMLPNGTNAYANTFLNTSTQLTATSTHLSYYSRTATPVGSTIEIGVNNGGASYLHLRSAANFIAGSTTVIVPFTTTLNSQGFWVGSKRSNTDRETYLNGTTQSTVATSDTAAYVNANMYLGAGNALGTTANYSNKECAFASIGDGLTDLESQLFYQITEKYQVALSRNINTTQSFYYNSAYNNETNAFLFSTQITDNTIQTATNTLVTDLKTANIFTKMKAIYPMVGGTATTCKFNLVNAQDTDAAFRLVFSGGGTFSANGYQPNGTNAFANTFLTPSTAYSVATNAHLSYYSRTDSNGVNEREMGSLTATVYSDLILRYSNTGHMRWGEISAPTSFTSLNSLGFYVGSKTAINSQKVFKNGSQISISANISSGLTSLPFFIGAINLNGTPSGYYSAKQCAFASIGDGLTDAEALALYNAVNAFQVTLARNV